MLPISIKQLLLCSIFLFIDALSMDPNVPTLASLCTKQIVAGYGNTAIERKNNAFKYIKDLSKIYNTDALQRSFLNHWLCDEGLCSNSVLEKAQAVVALIKNKKRLYGVFYNRLHSWDFSAGEYAVVKEKHIITKSYDVTCALASKKGPFFFFGSDDRDVVVFNVAQKKTVRMFTVGLSLDLITHLEENAGGDLYVTKRNRAIITVWDTDGGTLKEVIQVWQGKDILDLLVDNNMLYVATGSSFFEYDTDTHFSHIFAYDVRAPQSNISIGSHDINISCLMKSKNDSQLYSSSYDNIIKLWDIRKSGEYVHELKAGTGATLCLQEDDEGHLIAGGFEGIKKWDMAVDKPYITNILTHDRVYHMIHDADEGKIYASTDNGIKVFSSGCTFDQSCEDMEK